MNAPIVSARPDSPLFKRALISVLRIDRDPWVPDYGEPLLDMALVEVEAAMSDQRQMSLDDLRWWMDWPDTWRRLGFDHGEEPDCLPSDVGLAAILAHPQSPFGIQYTWPPHRDGRPPESAPIVAWRGHPFDRVGDWLFRWRDDAEDAS